MQTAFRIANVCLFLFVATVFGDVQVKEQERATKFNNTLILETCAAESNVTLDELGVFLSEDEPSEYGKNHPIKCAASCILRKRNVIVNGKLSIEGLTLYAENTLKSGEIIKSSYLNTSLDCYKKETNFGKTMELYRPDSIIEHNSQNRIFESNDLSLLSVQLVTDECEMALTYERCFNNLFDKVYERNVEKKASTCKMEIVWKSFFNKSSTFNATKCALGCYYRQVEWLANGIFVWDKIATDLDQVLSESPSLSTFEKTFALCSNKVKTVNDECEKGDIIQNCVEKFSENDNLVQEEEEIKNNGRSKRNVLSKNVEGMLSKSVLSSVKLPGQNIL